MFKHLKMEKVEGDGASTGATGTGTGTGDGAAAAAAAAATAATAAAAAAKAATGDGTKTGDSGTPQFAWSDGWREHLAAGDDKTLKRLERFGSPGDIFKSFRAIEQKMSSGELKANVPFPDKGTDEEKATWRKDAGLPEKPEAYDLKFDDGFVIGEDDKPIIDNFLKAAHAKNLPPNAVKESVRWYFDEVEKRAQERQEADTKFRQESEDALRAEWGNDYRKNVNLVKALIDTAPQDIREQITFARMADGKPLTSDPRALQWLVTLARAVNPVTSVMPGSDSSNVASSIDDEIKAIEKTMRTNRKEYNADAKMQERYRELLGAKEQLAKAKA